MYRLKFNVDQEVKVTKDKLLTKNTIDSFCDKHGEDYKPIFQKIKRTLQKIIDDEKVVMHEDTKIFYHTYNILFILFRYLAALDFYNSPEYKNTFAGLHGSFAEISQQYHRHRAESFDSSNAFTGDHKVKAALFRNFYYNREATDLYVNFFTLFPTNQIKLAPEDKVFKSIFDKILEHFNSTYIESENVIYKSLAINLNAYMKYSMGMKPKYVKKVTEELLSEMFDYTFAASSSDLSRNVYISGRLTSMPIFKHARNARTLDPSIEEHFNSFFQKLQKDFSDIGNITITAEQYFNIDPVKQFLLLKPIEFLEEIQ